MDARDRGCPTANVLGVLMPFKYAHDQRAYHREYYRPRMRARWQRYRAAGGCGECGEPSGAFSRCFRHRIRLADRKRRLRAGRARTLGYAVVERWSGTSHHSATVVSLDR